MEQINEINELQIYFKELKKYPVLTREQEYELAKRVKNGDTNALNKLTNANLRYVVAIANKYRRPNISFIDLISEGNIGLMKAIERFDYTKGYKLITFATWWIKNYIQMFIKNYDKSSTSTIDFDNPAETSTIKYKEIAEEINDNFNNEICGQEIKVNVLMNALQKREYRIIELYYGLFGNKEHTLTEISSEMNISAERVRQIKDKAMLKLRSKALTVDSSEFF